MSAFAARRQAGRHSQLHRGLVPVERRRSVGLPQRRAPPSSGPPSKTCRRADAQGLGPRQEECPVIWIRPPTVAASPHAAPGPRGGWVRRAVTLEWTYDVLSNRASDLAELTAARELWDWHRRFDEEPDRKKIAHNLEALYEANDLASEFVPLVSHDAWEERGSRAAMKADQLVASAAHTDIEQFIERGLRFLGDRGRLRELLHIAGYLGERAPGAVVVRDFVHGALSDAELTPRSEFATVVASRWVWAARTSGDPDASAALLSDLLDTCGSDGNRILLARHTYGFTPPPRHAVKPTPAEHVLLRALAGLFLGEGQGPAFLETLGWTFDHDWEGFRGLVEDVITRIPPADLGIAVNALSDSLYWGTRDISEAGEEIQQPVGPWLLDQILCVPDLDMIDGMFHWHVEEVLKNTTRPNITWLVDALEKRERTDPTGVRALPSQHRLSQYVRPVSPEDVDDPGVQAAVVALVDRACDPNRIAYGLLQYIGDVDPQGVLLPAEVVRRLEMLDPSDSDAAWRLARLAGIYDLNSEVWRTVARPVVAIAVRAVEKERRSLFSALTDPRPMGWSSGIGEVPQLFVDKVRVAKELLDGERDPDLQPFWQWNLKVVEFELQDQVERAKEDRGE